MLNIGSQQTLKFVLTNCQTTELQTTQMLTDSTEAQKRTFLVWHGEFENCLALFVTSKTDLANMTFYSGKRHFLP